MNKISNTIYQYYAGNFDLLPADKQFHFASRLWLWTGDAQSRAQLDDLKPWFTHHNSPTVALDDVVAIAKQSPLYGSKNALALRRPHFLTYPLLRQYTSVLFRLNFLQTVYNINASDLFYKHFQADKVESYAANLQADTPAMAMLSTHAVNFLYLYSAIVKHDMTALQPVKLIEIVRGQYNLADPLHLQLLIYFYTHCIIGESRFYAQKVAVGKQASCKTVLAELSVIIADNFERINLDNKFEYLVCCELSGVDSPLRERIMTEAAGSVAANGDFLVDQHNANPQAANITIDSAEHRNVLFIMANQPFAIAGK